VCGIEEYVDGHWVPSSATLQSANNFCLRAQFMNDKSHLAVGNFFQSDEELDWDATLDCRSVRLGDETKRQKITFDLFPPIREDPDRKELVIFERANGTRDGLQNAHIKSTSALPVDNFLPEAFAVSLRVDNSWTGFYFFETRAAVIEYKGQLVPDWKRFDTGYNVDFDAWATDLEFKEFGISEGSLVDGISIMNLQPGDRIRGPYPYGEVIFRETAEKVCDNPGDCTEPVHDGTELAFGPFDYDPDIVFIGPFTGKQVLKRMI